MKERNVFLGDILPKRNNVIAKVWEVYKKDLQHCLLFKTQEKTKEQTIFGEIDLISSAYVDLSGDELWRLETGEAIRL